MGQTYTIGDIHGALKALQQLIGKLDLKANDRLIFLGDYVDGWSQSARTIDYLMNLAESQSCIFIKGNHDAWCESWLNGNTAEEKWLMHGGRATVDSYAGYSTEMKARHLEFFNRMANYFQDESGRLFIHAGFASMHGPQREQYESNYSWDRTLWEMALAVDDRIPRDSKRYPKRLLLYPEIFIGHTPTTNYDIPVPMQAANVWNVDTGAAFYGRISALDVNTKQYWQSDTAKSFYPDEEGRNK